MRENDWKRFWAFAALMNEMDSASVNLGFEVRELIECRFLLPPVVTILPIFDEFLQIVEIGACIPLCAPQVDKPTAWMSAAVASRSRPLDPTWILNGLMCSVTIARPFTGTVTVVTMNIRPGSSFKVRMFRRRSETHEREEAIRMRSQQVECRTNCIELNV